jgi:ribosomal protein L35
MPKNKSHKGLLKRCRVTKSGKIKLWRPFGRHLRSHKSRGLLRSYRTPHYACPSEVKRLAPLLRLPLSRDRRAGAAKRDRAPAAPAQE